MAGHKIITIGRQFGSGGHEIGNILATRLDIPLYDNNLVRMAAEKLDIKNLILWHTEDKNISKRQALYLEEGSPYFSGRLFVPEDETIIDLD